MMNTEQVVELLEEYLYDLEADAGTLDRDTEYDCGYADALKYHIYTLKTRIDKIKEENHIEVPRPLQLSDIAEIY